MTVAAIFRDLARRGATARLLPTGKLYVEPAAVLDELLLADMRALRDEIIAELRQNDRYAADVLIARARKAGLELSVEGVDGLRVQHLTNSLPDPDLLESLCEHKAAVLSELRRESDPLTYAAQRGLYEAEWRVAGCSRFTILADADEEAERRLGACPACGGSFELHGSPDPSTWRRVATLDNVELAAVRFVLAKAGEIARSASTEG